MPKKAKWGYLGTETNLNGLTDWIFRNTSISGRRTQLNKIIQFGLEHDLINKNRHINYDNKRSVEDAADAVAKAINCSPDKQKLFQSFTEWILNHR